MPCLECAHLHCLCLALVLFKLIMFCLNCVCSTHTAYVLPTHLVRCLYYLCFALFFVYAQPLLNMPWLHCLCHIYNCHALSTLSIPARHCPCPAYNVVWHAYVLPTMIMFCLHCRCLTYTA